MDIYRDLINDANNNMIVNICIDNSDNDEITPHPAPPSPPTPANMQVDVLGQGKDTDILIAGMNEKMYFDSNGYQVDEKYIRNRSYNTYGKKGLTADGNTRLILRVQTNKPGYVSFNFDEDFGATFESLAYRTNMFTTAKISTTYLDDNKYQASAVLIAPERFPENKNFPSDSFTVKVKFEADDGTTSEENINLTIEAAPVMLIHGMFSNCNETFNIGKNKGVWHELVTKGYKVYSWDYFNIDPPSKVLARDFNGLFRTLTKIFAEYSARKIACTRTDIVAHGMGGLMARKFLHKPSGEILDDGNNWTKRSYKQGAIRRVITILTPHRGSPWADILCSDNNRDKLLDLLNNPALIDPAFKIFIATILTSNIILNQTGLSELQTNINRDYGFPENVPMYAIYGDIRGTLTRKSIWELFKFGWSKGDNINIDAVEFTDLESVALFHIPRAIKKYIPKLAGKMNAAIFIIDNILPFMKIFSYVAANVIFSSQAHDTIISGTSAAGDFAGHSSVYADDLLSPLEETLLKIDHGHWEICKQRDVGCEVALLLKGSKISFKTFGAGANALKSSKSTISKILAAKQNITTGKFNFIDGLTLKAEPAVFKLSERNTQIVNLTVTSQVSISHDIYFSIVNGGNFNLFTIPANGKSSTKFEAKIKFTSQDTGMINISCFSQNPNNSDGTSMYISNVVQVVALNDLNNINIVKLDFNGDSTLYTNKDSETPAGLYAIDENGNYYDISSPLNGTEWTSTEFAKVNDNGCIYGLKEGSTTLTAKFKNLTESINITVGPAIVYDDNESDLQIITESLDKAFTGKKYNFTLKASENNIKWSHTDELPPGLDFNESGIISGIPTKSGNYTFIIIASNGTDSASKKFTIIVNASGASLEITTMTLKNGTDGKKYSFSLKAKGAKSLTWQAANLPDGLAINESTGKISGTPKEYGNFENIIITASNGNDSIQKTFSLVINPVLPKFSGKLLAGYVYKEYRSSPLKISKGSEPITWSIKEILPPGLEFDSENGIISGTPTQGFNGKITIIATNAAGESANKLTLKITAEKPAITSINNYGLKSAIIGENYIISCTGTGTPPLSWDFTGFPEGMSYDVKTGILSGIINQSGKFKININLSNSSGKTAKKKFSLQIYNPPVITSDSLPEAIYKTKYNAILTATGDKTIKWRADNLPAGLKISSKGKISGTPTAAPGEYNITVTAYNSKIPAEYSQRETSKNFTLIINNNPDPKKAYITPQNSILANNDESESDSSSKFESEIINEPEKIISSNENLFIGPERDINSININISDDYIIAAVLPEIHVNKSGLYELEIELDENAQTNAKLFWLACPQNNNPSEDDEIAEFYNESGQEIFTVPENKLIIVSAWLNKDIIYAPVILVSK